MEPNQGVTISSWVMDIAKATNLEIVDNRAKDVKCYLPEYTFVEKLSAIYKKFSQEQEDKIMPGNFIRHYYDVYKLLGMDRVKSFIGTPEYNEHKEKVFGSNASVDLSKSEAFVLSDTSTMEKYQKEYNAKAPLYYRNRPGFSEIMSVIKENVRSFQKSYENIFYSRSSFRAF